MSSTQDFFDILQAMTVDCKDNGECFTVTDRVAVIERMLETTPYRLVAREPLALLYARRELREGDRVLLISSHIDCVYGRCFCKDEGGCLRGTFDNSFTNAALLWNMLNDTLPDNAVVAFTGDEERDSRGAVQTVLALGKMHCNVEFALVLDVTNVGWDTGACITLENDNGIDLFTAHKIVESVKGVCAGYAFEHNAEPDESWDYNDYGIPALSLCIPAKGDLHSDRGVLLRKCDLISYCNALHAIINILN